VLVDLMTAGISSRTFFTDIVLGTLGSQFGSLFQFPQLVDDFFGRNNPDLIYQDNDGLGYASATVTPAQLVVIFNKVKPLNNDGTAPSPPLAKRTRITINSGSVALTVEDNV
jgi:alkaline phosphatase D